MDRELRQILTAHAGRYPAMAPCDGVKLVFQNEFGGGHLIADEGAALARLREEHAAVEPTPGLPLLEGIGNGVVRVMLGALDTGTYSLEELCRDFVRSARLHTGDRAAFLEKLEVLRAMAGEGALPFSRGALEEYLAGYLAAGCPPASHSPAYRAAYRPAYRVVLLRCLPAEIAALLPPGGLWSDQSR